MSARRLFRAVLVVLVGLALVAAGGGAVALTRAAWTDPVRARASASAGTWQVPSTCTVRDSRGVVDPTTPCTVVAGSLRVEVWSASADTMQGNAYGQFSAPGIDYDQHVEFDVTLPNPTDARWSWATAGISNANGTTITSACSALPRVVGKFGANLGETPGMYLALSSPRTTPSACTG